MRKLLAASLLALSLALPAVLPSFVRAETAAQSYGLEGTGVAALGTVPTSGKANITEFVGSYIIKPILGIVGLAFFVLTIYGGVMWMVAGGNETMVKKAQDILRSALIGAVIIVAAYALTNAILNALTTGSISNSA